VRQLGKVETASHFFVKKLLGKLSNEETGVLDEEKFSELYGSYGKIFDFYNLEPQGAGVLFAIVQTLLYTLAEGFNGRIGGHFWADDSRTLIWAIECLMQFDTSVNSSGASVESDPQGFKKQLLNLLPILSNSGGTELPEDTPRFNDYLLGTTAVFLLEGGKDSIRG
jgi:hypothetical protein